MGSQIEDLVQMFEARTISRRQLVASLTLLTAASGHAAERQGAAAASEVGAHARSLNHVSMSVSDVERSAAFYTALLDVKVVSRPGNGGINLGLGSSFLGLYKLANPGSLNHCCLGVDDYDPERIAASLQKQGIRATIDRNPANRTSGGDQLYFVDPDGIRMQLSANGYQG
jgi:catechol 2,3-dioxygenase-like lactoylglutathione lyase family enzyme